MRSVGTGTSQLRFEFARGLHVDGQSAFGLVIDLCPFCQRNVTFPPTVLKAFQVLASFTAGTTTATWVDYLSYQAPQNLVYNSGQFAINGLPVDEGGSGIAARSMSLEATFLIKFGM